MSPLVTERDLKIGYNRRALTAPFEGELQRGQRWVIVGPNGVGKSTYLRSFLDSSLVVGGQRDIACPLSEVVYVPQSPRVSAQVPAKVSTFLLASYGASTHGSEAMTEVELGRIRDMAARLGLPVNGSTLVQHLSGGMLQRLWFARALLQKSRILLLDEPFASLDSAARSAAIELLDQALPTTLQILVVHDPHHVPELKGQVRELKAAEVHR